MPRRILYPLSLVLALSLAPDADAQTVQNVLVEAQLIGRWAANCRQPPSGTNIHSVYAVDAAGTASLAYESGPGPTAPQNTILAAKRVAPDRLEYEQVNRDTGARLTIQLVVTGTTIQVWTSRRADGEMLVENGRFKAGGASPLQRRCN